MDDLYRNYNFRILSKNSASPTIMIINKVTNHIYKIWSSDDDSDEAKGLDYENKVYSEKIKPMLDKNPDLPFLQYIGYGENTIQKLEDDIKMISDEDRNLFRLAMLIFLRNPSVTDIKWDKDFFDEWKDRNNPTEANINNVLNIRVKIIILPTIKFKSLHNILRIASTDQMKNIIKRIVYGIYCMYNNELVHNDLHSGNIMIEDDTDKVLIFDWDRAYMNGQPNPLLTSSPCDDGLCVQSQCNVYNIDGYAIDIYKILHYILSMRKDIDSDVLMADLFKIQPTRSDSEKLKKIYDTLTYNPFFNYSIFTGHRCTFLQFPDKHMRIVKDNFGSIEIILANTNSNIADDVLIEENLNFLHSFATHQFTALVGILITSLTVGTINVLFGFSKQKDIHDVYLQDNDLYINHTQKKVKNKLPFITKESKNINLQQETVTKKVIIDSKMASDIRKIVNIPPHKATFGNLRDAHNFVMRLKYGEPIPILQKPVSQQGPFPKSVYMNEIIDQSYNMRKNEMKLWASKSKK
jgi:hypothetical protein